MHFCTVFWKGRVHNYCNSAIDISEWTNSCFFTHQNKRRYNGNTGVLTAPRDGVDVLFRRISGINNSVHLFEFTLNGSAKTQKLWLGGSANPYRTSSNSIVLQVRQGDRVWIKMVLGGKHNSADAGGDQTFSGWLWCINKSWKALTKSAIQCLFV